MEALLSRRHAFFDRSGKPRERTFFTVSSLLIITYLVVGTFAIVCPLIHAPVDDPSAGRSCPWASQINSVAACSLYVTFIQPQWIPVFTLSFSEELYSFTFPLALHSRAPPQPF